MAGQERERDEADLQGAEGLDTPEQYARKIVHEAWQAPDGDTARALAEDALEIDPGCPEALTLLAELSADREVALDLLRRAVSAAEERIGPELFEQSRGHFPDVAETLPYMRARFSLARVLWDASEFEAAIEHAMAMLDLDLADELGVRNTLVGWLLVSHRPGAAAKILRRFINDGSATMLWARALQLYQSFGPSVGSEIALTDALKANSAVVTYLLQIEKPPAQIPDNLEIGGEGEAVIAALLLANAWYATDGAIDWLVGVIDTALANRPQARQDPRDQN